jgi:hypothetical protein
MKKEVEPMATIEWIQVYDHLLWLLYRISLKNVVDNDVNKHGGFDMTA